MADGRRGISCQARLLPPAPGLATEADVFPFRVQREPKSVWAALDAPGPGGGARQVREAVRVGGRGTGDIHPLRASRLRDRAAV